MMFRSAILFCSAWFSGVVAFAPLSPSSMSSMTARDTRVTTPYSSMKIRMAADTEASQDSETEPTSANEHDFALLFDCDGVILETEELHRLAYNAVFKEFGVTKVCGENREPVEWSVGYYDILQNSIGGGKPKMRHYFSQAIRFESNEHGDPTMIVATPPSDETDDSESKKKGRKTRSERESGSSPADIVVSSTEIETTLETLIDALQTRKTDLYKQTVENSATPRPGLLDLMDAALADPTIAVGVCSASTKEAAQKVLACTLGEDRVEKLDVCILGDDVSEKKPSPMIYNEARKRLGVEPATKCVVVEDSAVGLRAAKAAGMRCLITYTESTAAEDFYGMGADAKVPDLANNGNPVTLEAIFESLRSAADENAEPELLVGLKDDLPPPEPELELVETFDDDDEDEDLPFTIELEPISMEEVESFEALALEEVETPAAEEVETPEVEEPEPEPPKATLEPSAEESEAFAASEADVGAETLVRDRESAEDALPVTLSPTPQEQEFFSTAASEVEAASSVSEPEPAEATLEPSPEEIEAFAASEADVGGDTLLRDSESAEDVLPVTLSPTPEEQEFFSTASSEVEAAAAVNDAEEEESPEELPTEETVVSEEKAPIVEETVVPAAPTASRILKPKMMQDDMGNFSM